MYASYGSSTIRLVVVIREITSSKVRVKIKSFKLKVEIY
jgi:hypothetical protein